MPNNVLDLHGHHVHNSIMTLDQFMRDVDLTDTRLAQIIGRDRSTVGRYRARKVSPPGNIIAKLLDLSNNEITVTDLLPVAE